jgi:hypothetical protein
MQKNEQLVGRHTRPIQIGIFSHIIANPRVERVIKEEISREEGD